MFLYVSFAAAGFASLAAVLAILGHEAAPLLFAIVLLADAPLIILPVSLWVFRGGIARLLDVVFERIERNDQVDRDWLDP